VLLRELENLLQRLVRKRRGQDAYMHSTAEIRDAFRSSCCGCLIPIAEPKFTKNSS
jgi:hypothetical protein